MNLAEAYALAAGQKLSKPEIRESFYPLEIQKYVTLQPFSKEYKNYDYWIDVIEMISPALEKEDIKIVQIGAGNERRLPKCVHLNGMTNLRQSAYIIQNGLCHIGADSFGGHIASSVYNKPVVLLYSNNYVNNVKPFFGDSSNQVLLSPDFSQEKPVFTFEAYPKRINEIKPEKIASEILRLLKIDHRITRKYERLGSFYHKPVLDVIPNCVANPSVFGTDTVIFRMDLEHNIDNLLKQASVSNVVLVADREIDINLLKTIKPRVREIVFKLSESFCSPKYIKSVNKLGIKLVLISSSSDDFINSIKLDFSDYGVIHKIKNKTLDEVEKELGVTITHYCSSKIVVSQNKAYPSVAAARSGDESLSGDYYGKIIRTPLFEEDIEQYALLSSF